MHDETNVHLDASSWLVEIGINVVRARECVCVQCCDKEMKRKIVKKKWDS